MRVSRLGIEHFRGIERALLHFQGHTLLVGQNNVGKSTICEALDLALGPDRLRRFPPVDEFDFYNAVYLSDEGHKPVPARIEVVLTDLSDEIVRRCPTHLEFWHLDDKRILAEGEIDETNNPRVVPCLRIETVASYNIEEDEFEASTFFSHGTNNMDGTLEKLSALVKNLFGFIYLRTLRTGSRALSLERGSLLDVILKMQGIRMGLWEEGIKRLRELDPPIANNELELQAVLKNIEQRLEQYITVSNSDRSTRLYVSQLTREHLRKTISFFLSTSEDQKPVPFQHAGTGTLNTLVLALLSFIAEAKKDNVIFAMEEPEIAIPPHTQRRISTYLREQTTQCFVTSHSPYVMEQFELDEILILKRHNAGEVIGVQASQNSSIKEKTYRRYIRRGISEAMLGKGVIVAEGLTEQSVLRAVADKLEETNHDVHPLDLSGITIFTVDGDGSLSTFGSFFRELGLKTYAFFDNKKRTDEERQKLNVSFDMVNETSFTGMEKLIIEEIPIPRQWAFLEQIRDEDEQTNLTIPSSIPSDQQIKSLMFSALKSNKGNSYAARVVDLCTVDELPESVTQFLNRVYQRPREYPHL
jgi:putative ATP-dependent endonuclease of OLD family